MNKSDIVIKDDGTVEIFGQRYTEGFFRTMANPLEDGLEYRLEEEDGCKYIREIDKSSNE